MRRRALLIWIGALTLAGGGDLSAQGITIAPTELPSMTVGAPFSQQLTASGGCAITVDAGPGIVAGCTYTHSVTAGAVPNGLTLTEAGLLSGTPTSPGPYSFTVTANDAAVGASVITPKATGSRAYSGVVAAAVPALSSVALVMGVIVLFFVCATRLKGLPG